MTWIRVDDDVIEHPKTYRLARLLGVERTKALGVLTTVWGYASRHHIDGDVTDLELDALHGRLCWPADAPSDVREALAGSGWIDRTADGRYVLHNWQEWQGKLIEHRAKQRRAKQEDRQLRGPGWAKISLSIRQDRAMWRCECDGRCGGKHDDRCPSIEGDDGKYGSIKIEVAHLNGDQSDHDSANLMAMCRSCHKRYDTIKGFAKPGRRKELIEARSDRTPIEQSDRTPIGRRQPNDGLRNGTVRNDTVRNKEAAAGNGSADSYYIRCVVALNTAMQGNPTLEGEWMPLPASSQVGKVTWTEDGIPLPVAEEIIAKRCTSYRCSTKQRGPRSLTYFDAAVREAWEGGAREQLTAGVHDAMSGL